MADADDNVYLFVYEPESGQGILSAPVKRSSAAVEMRLPSTWSGLTVHVYGFTIGAGRDNLGLGSPSAYVDNLGLGSPSAYVGTGNVG